MTRRRALLCYALLGAAIATRSQADQGDDRLATLRDCAEGRLDVKVCYDLCSRRQIDDDSNYCMELEFAIEGSQSWEAVAAEMVDVPIYLDEVEPPTCQEQITGYLVELCYTEQILPGSPICDRLTVKE